MTASGRLKRAVFSPVQVSIQDREVDLDVMELPIGVRPRMGYLPLVALDLYPNPKKQTLEGNPAYDGKMVLDLL